MLFPRFTQRLTPVSASCIANISEIKSLCTRLLQPVLEEDKDKCYKVRSLHLQSLSADIRSMLQYKIELRIRNHNTVQRMALIEELAKCMPEKHTVDLENPEVFILVEIFKVRRRHPESGSHYSQVGRASVALVW